MNFNFKVGPINKSIVDKKSDYDESSLKYYIESIERAVSSVSGGSRYISTYNQIFINYYDNMYVLDASGNPQFISPSLSNEKLIEALAHVDLADSQYKDNYYLIGNYYSILFTQYIFVKDYESAYKLVSTVLKEYEHLVFDFLSNIVSDYSFHNSDAGTYIATTVALSAVAAASKSKHDVLSQYKHMFKSYNRSARRLSEILNAFAEYDYLKNEIDDPLLQRLRTSIVKAYAKYAVADERTNLYSRKAMSSIDGLDLLATSTDDVKCLLDLIRMYNLQDASYYYKIDSINDYRIQKYTNGVVPAMRGKLILIMQSYIYKQYMFGRSAKSLVNDIRSISELFRIADMKMDIDEITKQLPDKMQMAILAYICD